MHCTCQLLQHPSKHCATCSAAKLASPALHRSPSSPLVPCFGSCLLLSCLGCCTEPALTIPGTGDWSLPGTVWHNPSISSALLTSCCFVRAAAGSSEGTALNCFECITVGCAGAALGLSFGASAIAFFNAFVAPAIRSGKAGQSLAGRSFPSLRRPVSCRENGPESILTCRMAHRGSWGETYGIQTAVPCSSTCCPMLIDSRVSYTASYASGARRGGEIMVFLCASWCRLILPISRRYTITRPHIILSATQEPKRRWNEGLASLGP